MNPQEKFEKILAEIAIKFDEIDRETPYSVIIPKWWESMTNLQRQINDYLLHQKRISYHFEDGRII